MFYTVIENRLQVRMNESRNNLGDHLAYSLPSTLSVVGFIPLWENFCCGQQILFSNWVFIASVLWILIRDRGYIPGPGVDSHWKKKDVYKNDSLLLNGTILWHIYRRHRLYYMSSL